MPAERWLDDAKLLELRRADLTWREIAATNKMATGYEPTRKEVEQRLAELEPVEDEEDDAPR